MGGGGGHTELLFTDSSFGLFGDDDHGQCAAIAAAAAKSGYPSGGNGHVPPPASPPAPPSEPALMGDACVKLWALLGRQSLGAIASKLLWQTCSVGGVTMADLPAGSELHDFISHTFHENNGSNRLCKIQLVDVPNAFSGFSVMTRQLGIGRETTSLLNPSNFTFPEYTAGLDRLKRAFLTSLDPSVPEHANILFTFHGTSHHRVFSVLRNGPRPLRLTDAGFFCAGTYTALEAEYAARYSRMADADSAGSDGCFVMVLYAAVVGCAYVITRRLDYTGGSGHGTDYSNFYSCDPKRSVAMLGQYDSHFVPVKYYDPQLDYQACDEAEAQGHELISQSFMQLCPVALVYFR
eukprot:TRINITY_DN9761_c0_g1_i10.p1 TRINITY_DN9761_c0_g1~~TRINITY_DN9761_c0_g1_i10.p1  ORF type:complete len:350 (-),score=34.99 TRINITY_DN9761_c0_g1_i10:235-1284(-)